MTDGARQMGQEPTGFFGCRFSLSIADKFHGYEILSHRLKTVTGAQAILDPFLGPILQRIITVPYSASVPISQLPSLG